MIFQRPWGAPVADQLGLEQRVERLGQGVVVGVAGGADGGDGAGLGEPLGVADGEVLNSPVGVMHQAGDVLAGPLPGPQPHVEGVQGQVGAQAGRHLPAHDQAGVHVEDERGVDPAGEGADSR